MIWRSRFGIGDCLISCLWWVGIVWKCHAIPAVAGCCRCGRVDGRSRYHHRPHQYATCRSVSSCFDCDIDPSLTLFGNLTSSPIICCRDSMWVGVELLCVHTAGNCGRWTFAVCYCQNFSNSLLAAMTGLFASVIDCLLDCDLLRPTIEAAAVWWCSSLLGVTK